MAITTLDGALAGMQWPRPYAKAVTGTMVAGRPWSTWALAGSPGAGGFDTTLAGVTLNNSTAGAINFVNPGSGNTYLARIAASATIPGTLMLCDRLWHNGGFTITTTTAQTVNSATLPARDNTGTTNGDGILCGIEVSAACGAAAPAPTITYTNSANTASRSAGLAFATANSPAAGSFFPFGLQAGDLGIRSIQSYTQNTSWVSGTINLVMYRPIAYLELTGAYIPNAIDSLTAGFPRIIDSSCLFMLFVPSTTTTTNIAGSVVWTQG
jgi:hypothetical protein